jgi:nitroreductase
LGGKETVIMDFFSVVYHRRSIRQFGPEKVDRGSLEKIVAAGIEAPTGCNHQLKQYLILDDKAMLDPIRHVSHALGDAPAAIVLLMEPKHEFWVQDASAAMENMLLAAVALGYGACWVEGAIRRHEEDLRKILKVPDPLRIWSLMPVGKPQSIPDRPAKPHLSEVTHYNRFGVRK